MDSTYKPEVTKEPLSEGRYYLVDISPAVEAYLQVPLAVRMVGVQDDCGFTAEDMLDIELESIVACLDERSEAQKKLGAHANNLLEDYTEINEEQLKLKTGKVMDYLVPHTADQLDHVKVVADFGLAVAELFVEAGVYRQDGTLPGDYCTMLDNGVLVIRDHTSKILR